MKIIKNDKQETLIIKNSKFIGIIKKIKEKQDIETFLKYIKQKYPDANHICYAYILNNEFKYTDDKEPLNTAGKPIYEVLKQNDLNYTLAIVIRYFGGIKLGSNGLIHAYRDTILKTLENNIKDIEEGYHILIKENYSLNDQISYLLKDSTILKKEFNENIIIEAIIKKEILEKLSNINLTIIEKIIF